MGREWGNKTRLPGWGKLRVVDETKAGEEDKGREGLPARARACPGQCQPRSPALRAHLSASCSAPTASLVLLNQQSQDLGLGQGHVGIHAEVVGTARVLPAQVPAGRRTQGQWGWGSRANLPSQGRGATRSCTLHPCPPCDHRDRPRGFREVGPPWCRLGPAASKVPPNSKP